MMIIELLVKLIPETLINEAENCMWKLAVIK